MIKNIYIYILVYIGLHIIVDPAMSPMPPAVGGGGSASSRFRHPQIQLRQLPERGAGYVATGLLKRGELLLEARI